MKLLACTCLPVFPSDYPQRCNDRDRGKESGRCREAKDKQRGGKLIYDGIEGEIERKRLADKKRKGDIGCMQVGGVGGAW